MAPKVIKITRSRSAAASPEPATPLEEESTQTGQAVQPKASIVQSKTTPASQGPAVLESELSMTPNDLNVTVPPGTGGDLISQPSSQTTNEPRTPNVSMTTSGVSGTGVPPAEQRTPLNNNNDEDTQSSSDDRPVRQPHSSRKTSRSGSPSMTAFESMMNRMMDRFEQIDYQSAAQMKVISAHMKAVDAKVDNIQANILATVQAGIMDNIKRVLLQNNLIAEAAADTHQHLIADSSTATMTTATVPEEIEDSSDLAQPTTSVSNVSAPANIINRSANQGAFSFAANTLTFVNNSANDPDHQLNPPTTTADKPIHHQTTRSTSTTASASTSSTSLATGSIGKLITGTTSALTKTSSTFRSASTTTTTTAPAAPILQLASRKRTPKGKKKSVQITTIDSLYAQYAEKGRRSTFLDELRTAQEKEDKMKQAIDDYNAYHQQREESLSTILRYVRPEDASEATAKWDQDHPAPADPATVRLQLWPVSEYSDSDGSRLHPISIDSSDASDSEYGTESDHRGAPAQSTEEIDDSDYSDDASDPHLPTPPARHRPPRRINLDTGYTSSVAVDHIEFDIHDPDVRGKRRVKTLPAPPSKDLPNIDYMDIEDATICRKEVDSPGSSTEYPLGERRATLFRIMPTRANYVYWKETGILLMTGDCLDALQNYARKMPEGSPYPPPLLRHFLDKFYNNYLERRYSTIPGAGDGCFLRETVRESGMRINTIKSIQIIYCGRLQSTDTAPGFSMHVAGDRFVVPDMVNRHITSYINDNLFLYAPEEPATNMWTPNTHNGEIRSATPIRGGSELTFSYGSEYNWFPLMMSILEELKSALFKLLTRRRYRNCNFEAHRWDEAGIDAIIEYLKGQTELHHSLGLDDMADVKDTLNRATRRMGPEWIERAHQFYILWSVVRAKYRADTRSRDSMQQFPHCFLRVLRFQAHFVLGLHDHPQYPPYSESDFITVFSVILTRRKDWNDLSKIASYHRSPYLAYLRAREGIQDFTDRWKTDDFPELSQHRVTNTRSPDRTKSPDQPLQLIAAKDDSSVQKKPMTATQSKDTTHTTLDDVTVCRDEDEQYLMEQYNLAVDAEDEKLANILFGMLERHNRKWIQGPQRRMKAHSASSAPPPQPKPVPTTQPSSSSSSSSFSTSAPFPPPFPALPTNRQGGQLPSSSSSSSSFHSLSEPGLSKGSFAAVTSHPNPPMPDVQFQMPVLSTPQRKMLEEDEISLDGDHRSPSPDPSPTRTTRGASVQTLSSTSATVLTHKSALMMEQELRDDTRFTQGVRLTYKFEKKNYDPKTKSRLVITESNKHLVFHHPIQKNGMKIEEFLEAWLDVAETYNEHPITLCRFLIGAETSAVSAEVLEQLRPHRKIHQASEKVTAFKAALQHDLDDCFRWLRAIITFYCRTYRTVKTESEILTEMLQHRMLTYDIMGLRKVWAAIVEQYTQLSDAKSAAKLKGAMVKAIRESANPANEITEALWLGKWDKVLRDHPGATELEAVALTIDEIDVHMQDRIALDPKPAPPASLPTPTRVRTHAVTTDSEQAEFYPQAANTSTPICYTVSSGPPGPSGPPNAAAAGPRRCFLCGTEGHNITTPCPWGKLNPETNRLRVDLDKIAVQLTPANGFKLLEQIRELGRFKSVDAERYEWYKTQLADKHKYYSNNRPNGNNAGHRPGTPSATPNQMRIISRHCSVDLHALAAGVLCEPNPVNPLAEPFVEPWMEGLLKKASRVRPSNEPLAYARLNIRSILPHDAAFNEIEGDSMPLSEEDNYPVYEAVASMIDGGSAVTLCTREFARRVNAHIGYIPDVSILGVVGTTSGGQAATFIIVVEGDRPTEDGTIVNTKRKILVRALIIPMSSALLLGGNFMKEHNIVIYPKERLATFFAGTPDALTIEWIPYTEVEQQLRKDERRLVSHAAAIETQVTEALETTQVAPQATRPATIATTEALKELKAAVNAEILLLPCPTMPTYTIDDITPLLQDPSQQLEIDSQQSTVSSQQSAVDSQQSAVNSQQSAIDSQQSAANNQQSQQQVTAEEAEAEDRRQFTEFMRTRCAQPLPEMRPALFPIDLWRYVPDSQKPLVKPRWDRYPDSRIPGCIAEINQISICRDTPARIEQEPLFKALALANINAICHIDPLNPPLIPGKPAEIILKPNVTPVVARVRGKQPMEQASERARTEDMIETGKLEHSTSEWNNPTLLIPAKDKIAAFLSKYGAKAMEAMNDKANRKEVIPLFRLVMDLRGLNDRSLLEQFPLPRIDVQIGKCNKRSRRQSGTDIADAFFNVQLSPESRKYTAFSTSTNHLQYRVMPQGLHSAPAIFSRIIQRMFGNIDPQFADYLINYFDDIVNNANDLSTHIDVLQLVFDILVQNNLTAKPSKTTFNYHYIRVLGHIISEFGRAVDGERIKAVLLWDRPRTLQALQSQIGMATFALPYVENLASILAPLHELNSKAIDIETAWNEEYHGQAFSALKNALTSTPVLLIPDRNKPFRVHVDACKTGRGLGAVLLQEDPSRKNPDGSAYWGPCCYWSRKLTPAERKVSSVELECIAMHDSIISWHVYLFLTMTPFEVIVDCYALVYLVCKMGKSVYSHQRLVKLCIDLQQYWFTVTHRKGKDHIDADALSRLLHIDEEPYVRDESDLRHDTGPLTLEDIEVTKHRFGPDADMILRIIDRYHLDKKEEQTITVMQAKIVITGVDRVTEVVDTPIEPVMCMACPVRSIQKTRSLHNQSCRECPHSETEDTVILNHTTSISRRKQDPDILHNYKSASAKQLERQLHREIEWDSPQMQKIRRAILQQITDKAICGHEIQTRERDHSFAVTHSAETPHCRHFIGSLKSKTLFELQEKASEIVLNKNHIERIAEELLRRATIEAMYHKHTARANPNSKKRRMRARMAEQALARMMEVTLDEIKSERPRKPTRKEVKRSKRAKQESAYWQRPTPLVTFRGIVYQEPIICNVGRVSANNTSRDTQETQDSQQSYSSADILTTQSAQQLLSDPESQEMVIPGNEIRRIPTTATRPTTRAASGISKPSEAERDRLEAESEKQMRKQHKEEMELEREYQLLETHHNLHQLCYMHPESNQMFQIIDTMRDKTATGEKRIISVAWPINSLDDDTSREKQRDRSNWDFRNINGVGGTVELVKLFMEGSNPLWKARLPRRASEWLLYQRDDPELQPLLDHCEDPTIRLLLNNSSNSEDNLNYLYRPTTEENKPGPLMRRFSKKLNITHGNIQHSTIKTYDQFVIPKAYRKTILYHLHDQMGHPGSNRLIKTVQLRYWWPSMTTECTLYAQQCRFCELRKANNVSPKVPVQPYRTPLHPFHVCHIDLTGPLSKSDGYEYILLCKDALTKYTIIRKLPSKQMKIVVPALVEIFNEYGAPRVLVSDRGTEFTNRDLRDACRMLGTHKIFCTPTNPRSNGLAENAMRTIKDMLAFYCNKQQDNWSTYLSTIQHIYNTTINISTGYTPFYLLFGRECPSPDEELLKGSTKLLDIEDYVKGLRDSLALAWDSLGGTFWTDKTEAYNAAPRRRLPFKMYNLNQLAYIKRIPKRFYKDPVDELNYHLSSKLQERFSGPFRVTAILSPVLYKLMIHGNEKVVHAINMKPARVKLDVIDEEEEEARAIEVQQFNDIQHYNEFQHFQRLDFDPPGEDSQYQID